MQVNVNTHITLNAAQPLVEFFVAGEEFVSRFGSEDDPDETEADLRWEEESARERAWEAFHASYEREEARGGRFLGARLHPCPQGADPY